MVCRQLDQHPILVRSAIVPRLVQQALHPCGAAIPVTDLTSIEITTVSDASEAGSGCDTSRSHDDLHLGQKFLAPGLLGLLHKVVGGKAELFHGQDTLR